MGTKKSEKSQIELTNASREGVSFGSTSIVILFVLVFQLSIATPKVPGGIAASYTIILSQLGLPPDSVGILMAANVFIVNIECAFGSLVRFAAECSFANSMHAIDEEKLRSAR
ncbi:MAG: cation:dicarboxylase symporter family transporter [Atopobiaceae bacterium]|nr:cation:dicarboxylase symporter family transporter [Atopobiaceae bacterium]